MDPPADRRSQRNAIIGLSTSEMREPERIRHDPRSEPAGRELALGLSYPDVPSRDAGRAHRFSAPSRSDMK
jgi:hypothetical protein